PTGCPPPRPPPPTPGPPSAPAPRPRPGGPHTPGADAAARIASGLPTGHLGDPATIARMVVELARADAGSITGATIDINCGLYLR
ncbi:MAG: hypothetical protein ABF665_17235, partial [Gluconacetobacter sp.]